MKNIKDVINKLKNKIKNDNTILGIPKYYVKDPFGKIAIIIVVGLLIGGCICGLNKPKGIEPKTKENKFQIIKYYKDGYTCYDKETGYVYFRDGDLYKGGYTLMVNKEGKTYKYKNWDKIRN